MTRGARLITILAIIVSVVVATVIGIGIMYTQSHTTSPTTPARSAGDYAALFIKKYPALAGTGTTPIFTVGTVKKLADNWYSVTITSTNNGDSLRALVLDSTPSATGMSVVLGPGKTFNEADVPSDVLLPEQVYKEFIQ